jgi:pimeloyl-ACP methyl ester carboxylesterase
VIRSSLFIILASPILLLHGYSSDSSAWDKWVEWFSNRDMYDIYPIKFNDNDLCGPLDSHVRQLHRDIDRILKQTGAESVNIVAHSKGGLEARWAIAGGAPVDNLVMIATPNEGTLAALMDLTDCKASIERNLVDLLPGSNVTTVADSDETNYYAIAGNNSLPSFFVLNRPIEPHDGLVTVDSALSNYTSLGVYEFNHNELLTKNQIFSKVLPYINGTF